MNRASPPRARRANAFRCIFTSSPCFSIIFDIETAFFYPLAVKFNAAPEFLFVQAIIFAVVLAIGYLYILKKGVFELEVRSF